jgi:methylated-DNA-[protein]-cysteine S-methyltransferase
LDSDDATARHVFTFLDSPVGRLKIVATDAGLAAILWERDRPSRVPLPACARDDGHPVLHQAVTELREYFAGTRRSFTVPLALSGTEFQRKVWKALLSIAYGETRTYADIAKQIDHPTASRAVGAANGRNPVSIIAPCHRVVGRSGELRGFAGGVETKAKLLAHESARTIVRRSRV